ncbi:MAG TPA: response regulator [Ignavibacteria bacterium]|nr:response regulator [Ignavibacteria bacterium]
MKKFAFKSIKTRLTFWFLCVALIPLSIILVITYTQRAKAIEIRTFEKLTAIRDLKVKQLESWIDERIGDMKTASSNYSLSNLEDIINKNYLNKNDIKILNNDRQILIRYLENYLSYDEFFIINPLNGEIIISTNTSSEGEDKSNNTYFLKPMQSQELFIKDIYYSKEKSKVTMTFSIPIFSTKYNDNHIIGILVARIDLEHSLFNLLRDRVGLGKTGETLIVNKNVMALNELRWYENAPLNLKINAQPAVSAVNGETGIKISTDYRNVKVLTAYTYIPETGWGFVSKQDLYELNAPMRKTISDFFILFLVTALLIYIVTFFISKTISTPIVKLSSHANNIAKGNFDSKIDIQTFDETATLTNSINSMTSSLTQNIIVSNSQNILYSALVEENEITDFAKSLLLELMDFSNSEVAAYFKLNDAGTKFYKLISFGLEEEGNNSFDVRNYEGEFGKVLAEKKVILQQDIPDDTRFLYKTVAGNIIPKNILIIPLIADNEIDSLVVLGSLNKYSDSFITIVKETTPFVNSALGRILEIIKVRHFTKELENANINLQEKSEELQVQAEELQSQSEELNEQNTELEAQKKLVEESSRLKSQFLTNMSHELRTPLNSVIALSRVLVDQTKDKLSDEEINYLRVIDRNGKNLLNLINDILDLSKIESGKLDFYFEDTNLYEILNLAVDNLEPLSAEKKIELVKKIPSDITHIQTDQKRFLQVIENIVGNAIKFTDKGSVTVTARNDNENLYVEVIDTGIGISKTDIQHIFDEFIQADGSSTKQFEGTGLGLTISYKLIKELGGNLEVESKLGKGSKFTIIHPIKLSDNIRNFKSRQSIDNGTQLNSKISYEKADLNINLTGKRILLVEDNDVAIIQIKNLLEDEGLIIDSVVNVKEALKYIKNTVPDGFILDIMMPGIDGIEFLQKIRTFAFTKTIPVIMLTAKDLTHKELATIKGNNVYQLIYKGDINKKELVSLVKGMLKISTKNSGTKDKEKTVSLISPKAKKRGKVKSSDIPKILVVEDNHDNMIVIEALLKNKCKLLKAFDGKSGLELGKLKKPDLILMDITLPKIGGITVMKKLKSDPATSNIPIIALTAHAMTGDKEKFLSAGFDDYIKKPIDADDFIDHINKWVNVS